MVAESEERKVDVLSITVIWVEPTASGSGDERGAEADGRDVVALAEALDKPTASAFLGRKITQKRAIAAKSARYFTAIELY